jgi:acyl-CoA thioester hydrolase
MQLRRYSRRVNYYETDQMAIVHHTNYIRMFEEARLDMMEQCGMPYDEIERMGIIIPVVDAYARYHSSLRYGDELEVEIRVKKFNGIRLIYDYRIYIKGSGELSATGYTSHCFLLDGLPVNIKKRFPELYDKFMGMIK